MIDFEGGAQQFLPRKRPLLKFKTPQPRQQNMTKLETTKMLFCGFGKIKNNIF
jgi:hypothetical protein